MCAFSTFKINLKGLKDGMNELSFDLNTAYFQAVEGSEISSGKVLVKLQVLRTSTFFELTFELNGTITIPCNLCLDDMEYPISSRHELIVKFGDDYLENDELIVVPEHEGVLDVAWLLYEFVALDIPIRHVHAPGQCNASMASKLAAYTTASDGEAGASTEIDPRWKELEKLKQ